MLAEYLASHPEIVSEVESRTGSLEPTATRKARRERLRALLKELVDSLRHGTIEDELHTPYNIDGDCEFRDRGLLRTDILERLQSKDIHASPDELKLLSDWVWCADRARLSESTVHKATVLDLCPDAIAVVSLEGRIMYANRAAAQLIHATTGLSSEQIIGKTGRDLGFWVEAGPSPAEFHELARAHAVSEVLLAGRWHELRVREIVGLDGTVHALGFTLTDIHDRRLAQIRLELLSKLARLVGTMERDDLWRALTQVPIPQLADWSVVNVIENRKIRSTFIAQRDPSKARLRDSLVIAAGGLQDHPLWQGMLPTGFQLLSDVNDELLRTLVTDDVGYKLLQRVGVRSLMVVPVVSRGEPIAILTLAYTAESNRHYGSDDPSLAIELALHAAHIAENARLLAETKVGEARFRVGLADARTHVYEQDEHLRYIWHYSPDMPSFVGKMHADVLPPEEAAALTRLKQHALEEGEPISAEMELSFGGDRRWYRETIEPVRDTRGRPCGVIGAATDLTEQKETQQRLNLAVEMREKVMGVLGHDLRNPLNAMELASQILQQRDDLPPDAQAKVTIINRAAHRMTEMIETLLDFTRVRMSGKPLPIERTPCEIATIAREIVDESRTAWPDRQIELETRGATQGSFDAARMGQVISNLLANALSYGDPSDAVRISVTGEQQAITIVVHNRGEPIPESLLPVLFDPFVRGHADVVSPQGLGLGLFVVKEVIGAHGGTIDVRSTVEDGTTFTIHLPA